ncbi:MAG: type IV secretion system protein [Treponema sp.]|jgi:hypothetical protein|nr:type IV secretion system protein [Treponema sp.]
MAESAEQAKIDNVKGTYGKTIMMSSKVSEDGDPEAYFGPVVGKSRKGNTTVVPAAFLQVILLTAGECLEYADPPKEEGFHLPALPDFGTVLKGLLCAFFVIIVGVFALIEYLVAYLEFIFVSSVGVFLFPFSMWDGSKFLTEKFISALVGFFIKLLFSTICIFLALYGFSSLARRFVEVPFTGLANELVMIVFSCLLYFYLCKSAPAMAQSLMTGSPSLNAAGAIGAAAAAVGAVAGTAGLGARAAMSGTGTLARAGGAFAGAAGAARELGGGGLEQLGQGIGAFAGSLGGSASGAVQNGTEDLARSLMAKPVSSIAGLGTTGGGGGSPGYGGNSVTQRFLTGRNDDGTRKGFGDVMYDLAAEGRTAGRGFVTGRATGMLPAAALPAPETTTATSRAEPAPPESPVPAEPDRSTKTG